MNDTKIDLRSDTVTEPTEAMREAMYRAEVGDDVLMEDPTTNRLEGLAAEILGKEAALFVPSGTFGNQAALFSHCPRGAEVILAEQAHIVQHEAGASAILSAVQLRTFEPQKGYPTWSEIERRIRKGNDIHYPPTGLIVLENALSDGDVMPQAEMQKIHDNAAEHRIPIHLDGARIFNAAAYLELAPSQLAGWVDSVMFCLSKGLCAPVGSLLAGEKGFVQRARKRRKIMGGGMRQTGIMAAAGIVALETMTERVVDDRRTAEQLAGVLGDSGLFEVKSEQTKINMVFARFKQGEYAGLEANFVQALGRRNILTYPPEDGWLRFVTHYYVARADIEFIASVLQDAMSEIRKAE